VGNPNVGKSVVFNRLTRRYVTVSNYPGTTVQVTAGSSHSRNSRYVVVDTPGMYSLLPLTGEEEVARNILLDGSPDVVVHVGDAKNLEKTLSFTLELLEAGLPVVLDLNMIDEAARAGLVIDTDALERKLGISVVPTISTSGEGIDLLCRKIESELTERSQAQLSLNYEAPIEDALRKIAGLLRGEYGVSKRSVALLLLQGDTRLAGRVEAAEGSGYPHIQDVISDLRRQLGPVSLSIQLSRHREARRLASEVSTYGPRSPPLLRERLSHAMMSPLTGLPILAAVIFLGLYLFVGVFGAGILVDFLENNIFGKWVNPVVVRLAETWIPWPVVREVVAGQYGIVTLGVRYAVAIILPIVGTFFLVFSIIEDSGYLPRLAMLVDRAFKKIGLSGRAVIPMTLGFGCDTMATMVTRTLETRRERTISTLLLALAIPCSAQLGVILAILAGRPVAWLIWAVSTLLIFLMIGYLSARVLPGTRPSFYMELSPLRIPRISNILVKTYSRMEWYFKEVFPLFILASVLIWAGRATGLFQLALSGLAPVVRSIGLPQQASVAFLFGFFRRDYGAAGLYDLQSTLSTAQLVVAAVTLTLFVPCIAQLGVMIKERGLKTAAAIVAFIFPFAFSVGFVLNIILGLLGGLS